MTFYRNIILHPQSLLAVLLLVTAMLSPHTAMAQTEEDAADSTHIDAFYVAEFKTLANDISAFIEPVYDLNDEACALIKVVGPVELAFSTPLGIVQRRDEVGEIWLFLPKGSRRITIKHPQHGVIRDYAFASPLESRMTYEMKLFMPMEPVTLKRDTLIVTQTITETVRDTVVISRKKPKLPWQGMAGLTLQVNGNGTTKGIFLALMRRHGLFLHGGSMLSKTGDTRFDCDESGLPADGSGMPYYTGKTRHSGAFITAGAIHRLSRSLRLFEGAGWSSCTTAWELAQSEGGGYARNADKSHSGMAFELGMMYVHKRWNVSVYGMNTAGGKWHIGLGIGLGI